MKYSKFTTIKKIDNNYILFNSLYSSLIVLSKDEYNKLNYYLCNLIENDLAKVLMEQKIIVENEENEDTILYSEIERRRKTPDEITFTIAITMDCNFSCYYCYEDSKNKGYMNEYTAIKTAEFILGNISEDKDLKIIWYGGEPLLHIEYIELITSIITENKIKYRNFKAEIVTNGYLLDEENCKKLKDLNISFVQITIDGYKNKHDKRRCLKNGTPTYEKILNNLLVAKDFFTISLRINIDKDIKYKDIIRLFEDLKNKNISGKIQYYFAPIENFQNCNDENLLTDKEFAEIELKLYEYLYNNKMIKPYIPQPIFGFCEAINKSDFVIAPNGDLYKCWVQIGDKRNIVGHIEDDKKLSEKELTLFDNFILMKDDKCLDCKVKALCLGGCPLIHMNYSNSKCVSWKYNLDKYLEFMLHKE